MKRIIALISVMALLVGISGCSTAVAAANLMDGIPANDTGTAEISDTSAAAVCDFSVRLFAESFEDGKNTLISPYSVLNAMAMTANGAKGDTLSQIEQAFGLNMDELNEFMRGYKTALPSDEKCRFHSANSIWFKDSDELVIERDFLQANADYYGAGAYKSPFDSSTIKDINNWVSLNTDGMIKNIVDEIPEDGAAYLVNALSFDAEWEDIYRKDEIEKNRDFTKEDGTKQKADLMYSTEGRYLSDESASGFVKPYKGGKYAFAALLPNEGVTVSEYIGTLTGEHLRDMLQNSEQIIVYTALPKFKTEYDTEMSGMLSAMGITDAFDWSKADFTAMGHSTKPDENLFISRVLHKTFIEVDEKGTKAGAAAVVEMLSGSAAPSEEPHTVYLDRPFVYMIIDTENNIPVFIGTVMDME